ncbi:hypothetical protein [Mycobacterium sp.]|jgi:hypothetical protein|uniref:hypothetical protein n=1 Tax=Mycobacterium sp. TaxID=1785 RepID=UPI002D34EAD6|nr:hypothetical protein [Mycobacterium sp.]HZA08433.1 hypothetical protein [Mycobacterium sp.]
MSLKPGHIAPVLGAAAIVVSVAIAPIAVADPVWPFAGAEPADATIEDLQSQGYDVAINWVNGISTEPLSLCNVTGIHNPDIAPARRGTLTTVYVDIVCPSGPFD